MSGFHFATFWQGTLSGFEAACLASFVRRGHRLTVYSFEPVGPLPDGVETADASTIVARHTTRAFLYGGRANLSHFSDYFRYKLFQLTDQVWVDADMLLVGSFEDELPATLLAREKQPTICGAILRLEKGPALDRIVAKTEAKMNRALSWGETGPALLYAEIGHEAMLKQAAPASRFYALDHDEFWKAFLPAYADECEAVTATSTGLHLWNNVVERLGIWKRFAPPPGSYLHRRWAEDQSLRFFDGAYPEPVMRQMIENWRLRQNGAALGIGAIVRQALPSVNRTFQSYCGPNRSLATGLTQLRNRLRAA